jgi:alkanesulfonate monooxygenase SsuD/methylene tetrahydromethanopterin reductase-like flavin-dependent oxidoreductase (luciferase family)
MTIDHISNGRLEVGIGAGAPGRIDPSYRMTGIEDWQFEERVERFREQIAILDALLRNKESSYKGNYYNIEGAIIEPRPIQDPRPPLVIAAHADASLRIAAEYADTWASFGDEFGSPPERVAKVTRKRMDRLDKYCKEYGRDFESVERSLLVFGSEGNVAFASEEHFTEIVKRYANIGITELVFFYPFFAPDQFPMVEKIAEDTIPSLRDL